MRANADVSKGETGSQEASGSYDSCEVVVVGGGPAGLSGALLLARCLRSVVVLDSGKPRNVTAAKVGGVLTRDCISPGELLELGRKEVAGYGVKTVSGEVVDIVRADGAQCRFRVTLEDGKSISCRRVLVASGAVDELPAVKGIAPLWGLSVLHCPFCHGFEHQGQRVGVLNSGKDAVEQALLFRQLSDDVLFFTHSGPALTQRDKARLRGRGIRAVEGDVVAVECEGDQLARVRMADGSSVDREVMAVQVCTTARTGFLKSLSLAPVDHGEEARTGCHVHTDHLGRSAVPGVWFAGNCTDTQGRVVSAMADGTVAAAHINIDLVNEDADMTRHEGAVHQPADERLEEEDRRRP